MHLVSELLFKYEYGASFLLPQVGVLTKETVVLLDLHSLTNKFVLTVSGKTETSAKSGIL